jgi:hypothetical protein
MRFVYRHALVLGLALTGALLLAACGGDGGAVRDGSASPATTAPAGAAGAGGAKVSANDASESDLVAAFEAAGVPNAEKWAEEVMEYRPYDEPTFAKLREELAKYNPGPGVVDKIISTLEL